MAPISADRVLGLLSKTMGNVDQAAEHFNDALALCCRAGYGSSWPEVAATMLRHCCNVVILVTNEKPDFCWMRRSSSLKSWV